MKWSVSVRKTMMQYSSLVMSSNPTWVHILKLGLCSTSIWRKKVNFSVTCYFLQWDRKKYQFSGRFSSRHLSLKLSLLCICLVNEIVYLPCHAVQLPPPRYSCARTCIFVYLYICMFSVYLCVSVFSFATRVWWNKMKMNIFNVPFYGRAL